MRAGFRRIGPAKDVTFNSAAIKYALLACLRYTNKTKELAEMFAYVFLCSCKLAEQTEANFHIFELIDVMVEVVGADYRDDSAYLPAEIFGRLNSDMRWLLFDYINEPDLILSQDDLFIAKARLNELLIESQAKKITSAINEKDFLLDLRKYLRYRLSKIMSIVIRYAYHLWDPQKN